MKKLTTLIFLIICSYQIIAQWAPSFISDMDYIDLEQIIPLDTTLISLNPEREKYGLIPISRNWKQLKWEVSYYQNSSTIGLKNEQNELVKIISRSIDEDGKVTSYSEYDIQKNQLNGKAFNIFHGKINRTETFQNNQLAGEIIFFDTFGQPAHRAEYKNNLPWNGTVAGIRLGRKTGKIFPASEDYYQDGLKTKSVSYHFEIDTIVIQHTRYYKDEKIYLSESYHQNGKPSHTTPYGPFELRSGEAKGWDDKGDLSLNSIYLFGEVHGESFNTYYKENTIWYWYGKKLKDEAAFKAKEASYSDPHFFQDSIYNALALKASIEKKWKEGIDTEENLLQILEESFFSEHKNLNYFRLAHQKIAEAQQVKLLPSLYEIYKKVEDQCLVEYDSKVHPVFNNKIGTTIRGFRKSILQLEVAAQKFKSEKEEIDFLITSASAKIKNETDFVDAEFQLLHECGMPVLVQEAVKLIDHSDHLLVKLFGINLLQKLEADSLRPILLERLDTFKGKSPVYLWMLQMMAGIGEETDIDFLVNVIKQNEDEFITQKISRSLWNKKQKNQWIKNWILKSPEIRELVGGRSFGTRNFSTFISPTVTDLDYFAYTGRSQKIILLVGTYFGDFSANQLIDILEKSNDYLELIKASNTLGERHLAGQLQLTAEEQNRIDKIVSNYIENSREQYGRFCTSELQIERLWLLAEPVLWKYLTDKEFRNTSFVARQLVKMKNPAQIQKALDFAKDCKSKSECRNIFSYFDNLQYTPKIDSPRRNAMDNAEFQKLHNEVILPFTDSIDY